MSVRGERIRQRAIDFTLTERAVRAAPSHEMHRPHEGRQGPHIWIAFGRGHKTERQVNSCIVRYTLKASCIYHISATSTHRSSFHNLRFLLVKWICELAKLQTSAILGFRGSRRLARFIAEAV